ncbi:MAG TPA: ABC transporter permease [Ktedonobacterales bacterium]
MTHLRIHLRSTFAIFRKDTLDTLFSIPTLSMLLTPVVLSLLFAALSGLLGTTPTTLLVYNPERSRIGQVVSQSLSASQVTIAEFPDEVSSAFAPGKSPAYTLGMDVPPGFDASLERGEHPQLALYFNGSQLNALQRQHVVSVIDDYARSVSHAAPTVIITPATSDPATLFSNLDLSTFYVALALLTSISVGISLVSTLLVEEKQRKTLHMLLISPATLTDVVLGKLLVGVVYQLILSVVVMALLHGFVGNLPLVLLFVLLITGFGHALSLLAGSVFHTTSGLGGFLGIVSLLFVLPAVFASPLGTFFGTGLIQSTLRLLPTYYMADGLLNALKNQGAAADALLDLSVTVGGMLICLVAAIWILHRQTTVTATV